jgi:hypothetical protein
MELSSSCSLMGILDLRPLRILSMLLKVLTTAGFLGQRCLKFHRYCSEEIICRECAGYLMICAGYP